MTSIRLAKVYEDHLYYPMVVGHRIVEMSGRDINNYDGNKTMVITKSMWDDLMTRIDQLERSQHGID
jgi:hypothetical protein